MLVNQRPLAAAVCALLLLVPILFAARLGHAQTGTGGLADQIEAFRNLTPDQQDAILKQLGGSGGATSGSGLGGSGALGSLSSDRQGSRALSDAQSTERNRTQQLQGDEDQLGTAFQLKGGDVVVIEIDYHLPPKALSQSLQSFYAAQGISPAQLAAQTSSANATVPQLPASALAPPASNTTNEAEPKLSQAERDALDSLIDQVRAKNPYTLTHDGSLVLPGMPPIALIGLTDDQASMRLKAEPVLNKLDVRLTKLPLKKTGLLGLRAFGYDLFDRSPSTFSPVTNVPVPADYVLGAGDELEIQLYGSQNRTLRLSVGRDGRINFPELGPIEVGGDLFSSAKAAIEARVARQIIGVRASVAMGDTRTIRVFVLGEAKRPGSYTISGLGTITSALFAAGGVKTIGSLRDIQLKRQGTVERRLDLYDMLIRGNTTDDARLRPGDVIFIPPIKTTVAVDGEVRRPAIYEVKNESTVEDVVQLAGGLTADADRTRETLTRIDENQHRIALRIDPTATGGPQVGLRNGDMLLIPRLRPTLDSGVLVQGHVYTPGVTAYRDGLRLSNVFHSVDDLQPNADLHYVLIRREMPPDRRIAVLSADLSAAINSPGSPADLQLMPRDRITVFDLASGRDYIIMPLMNELRVQANSSQPARVVHVDGRVKVPGEYPLESDMRVSDLVRAGGGLEDAAYGTKAELTRYQIINGETRRTELINIDLAAALRGDPAANIKLESFDNLSVKEVSEWHGQESVVLTGEVRFPGRYSIRRGETLKSVIARAGGLSEFAFAEGAVFTRVELKKREQEQIDLLTARMQKDLTILAVQASAAPNSGGGGGAAALAVGQQLFAQLKSIKAVGRLVIDLRTAMAASPGSSADVILRNEDELVVPRVQQEVTVIGEVQNVTSHLYSAELSRDDYIAMSGGTTRRADQKNIYVVHANGSVVANQGNRWFHQSSVVMKPGDTVVVPLDAEHIPSLPYWQAVTTILYNVAIAVAAVHSL